MVLCEGSVGQFYTVEEMTTPPSVSRRLESLGVTKGVRIEISHQKRDKKDLIIRVRGTRLALGRKIAEGIFIKEALNG